MAFDIENSFCDKSWLEEVSERIKVKMRYGVKKAQETSFIPFTSENGEWKNDHGINWWTNGFWPASMWQMYLMTGDEIYREEAIRTEKMMDEAFHNYSTLDHDVGFMWLINSGVHYAMEGNEDSLARTMFVADVLACRYNPNGYLRAWKGRGNEIRAIIDCMMNLPLLYWASEMSGDPRYRLMAMSHADTALRNFLRNDGSCNHIVDFNPLTGEVTANPGGQGYASGSSWSRGQAWALYGFTLSHLYTGKQEYLDAAKRVANYFIANISDDYLPRCDFRQPEEPNIKDDAAATIAVCGLMELCRFLPELEAKTYFDVALRMLRALDKEHSNWNNDDPAILNHGTGAYHDIPSRHTTMNYADYYFIEAINKLRGEKRLFWRPIDFPQ